MQVRILGSAAGGGCPQWNCGCHNCHAARADSPRHQPRTQSSLAISADHRRWFLFNASPDVRVQLAACPPLWPRPGARESPFAAVVLTDAEMDHTLGLLSLREERHLRLYATPWVYHALREWHPLLRVLGAYCTVEWAPVRLGAVKRLCGADDADDMDSGLLLEAFSLAGTKAPAFAPAGATAPDMVVGYRVTDARSGRALVYMPGVHHWSAEVEARCTSSSCVLFDGTCWDEHELGRLGVASKTARAMGHLPIGGADGSLARLARLAPRGGRDGPRRVYVHLNNTNPVLDNESPERRAVEECGVEVAYDGMEFDV
jgi:pyrroloquinoline quinone biosynthesis protein B